MPPEGEWLDDEAGPVVRPYAITGGLTRSAGERLDLLDMACAVRNTGWNPALTPEQTEVLDRCPIPVPLVELAADLDLPTGVVRILVSDLRERGLVTIHRSKPAGLSDLKILQEVVNGLRGL
jgi:hypothetical protein